MITHILILALIVSASAVPRALETPQVFTLKVTVQDEGDLNGHECTAAGAKCTEYKGELCEYIRKSIKPITVPYVGFCDVNITSGRTEENKLEIELTLKLDAKEDKLHFTKACQTFKGALNQALVLLHNSPELRVELKEITAATELPETYEISVKGKLYKENSLIAPKDWNAKDICEVRSQITNLNMSSSLLNVMYMFGEKNLRNFMVANETQEEEPKEYMAATFTLIYPKSFFEATGIDPKCEFETNLKWGFTNKLKTGYHLEIIEFKKLEKPSEPPAQEETVEFEYTAVVLDNGTLYEQTCNITEQECPGYKQAVCKLAEKALVCGRLPSEGKLCTVEITNTTGEASEVNVKLTMLSKPQDQYTITKGCSTFGALYAQACATYDFPKMHLQAPPASYEETPTEKEFDQFLVTGTLLRKAKPIPSSEWKSADKAAVESAMKDFHTTDDVTQAFFRAKRSIKDLKVDAQPDKNVTVSFTMEYLTAYISKSQIDPYCDLIGMMQWGFNHPDVGKDYSIDSDVTIEHTSPITTPPTTTIAPTTSPGGTDTEKEPETTTTTPDHGVNVKPSSFLCLLIVNLMYLLYHA